MNSGAKIRRFSGYFHISRTVSSELVATQKQKRDKCLTAV